MKKLKLKALELGAKEVLTREQLKQVIGGVGSGTDGCSASVTCSDGGSKSCSCDDGSCSSDTRSVSCSCKLTETKTVDVTLSCQ